MAFRLDRDSWITRQIRLARCELDAALEILNGDHPTDDDVFGARRLRGHDPTLVAEWQKTAARVTRMVTRARFERATPSFGGWCSIQAELPGHVWWGVLGSNQ